MPKIAVITRKAYGGAYIVMSSNTSAPIWLLAWPTAEIAVMGAEGAISVLHGKEVKQFEGDVAAERARLKAEFRDKFGKPYYAAASGHVDDIIAPSETRTRPDRRARFPARQSGLVAAQEAWEHTAVILFIF